MSGGSSVQLVKTTQGGSSYIFGLTYQDFLTEKTSVVVGCRTVYGCVVQFLPLGTLFVAYLPFNFNPCIFKTHTGASTVNPSECLAKEITGPYQYFWFSWNRQTKEIKVGKGMEIGTNQLVSGNYPSGDITDLLLRCSNNNDVYGFTEFYIFPDQQLLALNRQPTKGEVHFYGKIFMAEAIRFCIRGQNSGSLYLYKKGTNNPVVRIKYTEGSNAIRVYTTDSEFSNYIDLTPSGTPMPGLSDDPKFYWMSWDPETKTVNLGEGQIIGENKLMTEIDSYINTGVEFDSIMLDTEAVMDASLELTLFNPIKKSEVFVNDQRKLPDVTSLYKMVDSNNETCMTLRPDLGDNVLAVNVYRLELYMFENTTYPVVDVYTPNTKCTDILALMDFEDYPIVPFSGSYRNCVLDKNNSVDQEMCRFLCDGEMEIKKISVVHMRREYVTEQFDICDVLIYAK